MLLGPNEITGGFKISGGETTKPNQSVHDVGTMDKYIYIMIGERVRFKDRLNPGNWTISLSGSRSGAGVGSGLVHFTDDSKTTNPTATIVGNRYNIVSGTNGTPYSSGSTYKTMGWFYPEMGAMIFSQTELSASIPGVASGSATGVNVGSGTTRITASFVKGGTTIASESLGFAPNPDNAGNPANALRFINCLQPTGAYMKFRSEEDRTSVSYFCRVKANQVNFSNNPTFVSGSQSEIRIPSMRGNPTVYATGIQLYNNFGDIVAVGKLSTAVKKNFSSEVTIKVKLDF
jgi:hypothetical protein